MPHWLQTAATAAVLAAVIWVFCPAPDSSDHSSAAINKAKRKRRGNRQPPAPAPAATPAELAAVQQLLRHVYAARGWSAGPYQFATAWQQAEVAAVQAGWDPTFDPQRVTAASLTALAHCIDRVFFNGLLHPRWLCNPHHPPLAYRVVSAVGPDDDWLALFHVEDNSVRVNVHRWAKVLDPDHPINCEGVICTNRLQLLLHTLAHELVHALVFNTWPKMDAASEAYRAEGCHGPLFKLLNRQLFGHSSTAFCHAPATR